MTRRGNGRSAVPPNPRRLCSHTRAPTPSPSHGAGVPHTAVARALSLHADPSPRTRSGGNRTPLARHRTHHRGTQSANTNRRDGRCVRDARLATVGSFGSVSGTACRRSWPHDRRDMPKVRHRSSCQCVAGTRQERRTGSRRVRTASVRNHRRRLATAPMRNQREPVEDRRFETLVGIDDGSC